MPSTGGREGHICRNSRGAIGRDESHRTAVADSNIVVRVEGVDVEGERCRLRHLRCTVDAEMGRGTRRHHAGTGGAVQGAIGDSYRLHSGGSEHQRATNCCALRLPGDGDRRRHLCMGIGAAHGQSSVVRRHREASGVSRDDRDRCGAAQRHGAVVVATVGDRGGQERRHTAGHHAHLSSAVDGRVAHVGHREGLTAHRARGDRADVRAAVAGVVTDDSVCGQRRGRIRRGHVSGSAIGGCLVAICVDRGNHEVARDTRNEMRHAGIDVIDLGQGLVGHMENKARRRAWRDDEKCRAHSPSGDGVGERDDLTAGRCEGDRDHRVAVFCRKGRRVSGVRIGRRHVQLVAIRRIESAVGRVGFNELVGGHADGHSTAVTGNELGRRASEPTGRCWDGGVRGSGHMRRDVCHRDAELPGHGEADREDRSTCVVGSEGVVRWNRDGGIRDEMHGAPIVGVLDAIGVAHDDAQLSDGRSADRCTADRGLG